MVCGMMADNAELFVSVQRSDATKPHSGAHTRHLTQSKVPTSVSETPSHPLTALSRSPSARVPSFILHPHNAPALISPLSLPACLPPSLPASPTLTLLVDHE